jgi:membrane protein
VGILFLIIILILSDIESAFNDIWGIRRPRTLGRKVSDYLSLMLICPFLFITSSAITVVIAGGVREVVQKIDFLGAVSPAIISLVNLLPYCVLWILFTYLYLFLPNTKINFRSGAVAGIIAASIYTIFQWGYINFQILVARYNAIYGSFAALPLFFVWLHMSWLIMLFGAEISFASQNVDDFEFEKDCRSVSHAFKRLLSLSIVHLLVKHFSNGGIGWSAIRISKKLEIPLRLVNGILYELVSSGLVSEITATESRTVAFQPARDPETMTVKSVIDALEQNGTSSLKMAESEELQSIMKRLEVFNNLVEESEANQRIKDI